MRRASRLCHSSFSVGIIPNPSRTKRRWREDYARAGNSRRSVGNERYEFHLVVSFHRVRRRDENFDGSLIELAVREV